MTGKDHGGARPFMIGGDRCFTCHDKETADMGKKMVTGAKAESTPIPGKRGSIRVSVDSTHDAEKSLSAVQLAGWRTHARSVCRRWQNGSRQPDKAGDHVRHRRCRVCRPRRLLGHLPSRQPHHARHAGRSNRWRKRGRPAAGCQQRVDQIYQGEPHRYRSGGTPWQKRGGWDKLKSADELNNELASADSWISSVINRERPRSRMVTYWPNVMSGGQGAEFSAELNNGTWTVMMKRKLKSDKPGHQSGAG